MSVRPRIDLDGVALFGEGDPLMPLASFRYRTVDGLLLLIPESGEELVRWPDVREAQLDLASGTLAIRFDEAYARRQNWLRGSSTLEGRWTDRIILTQPLAG